MTICVAITVEATIHYVSKEDFESFFLQLGALLSVENLMDYVVIMDNAMFHNNLSVPEV